MANTTSSTILLLLRLTVGLLCAVMNGIEMSFNVYAVILKETFNFTQTQVELTASMGCVGSGLMFLEPLITGALGYTTTFAASGISLALFCGLYAFAAKHSYFFHSSPIFVYLIQLGLTTGSGVAYLVVSRICLEIVPEKHTGIYIGAFGSAICFGKIFFSGLCDMFFYEDLFGFFLCLSVLFAVIMTLCYALLYPVTKTMANSVTGESETETTCLRDILRSPFFQMMFWTAAVFSSSGYTVLTNITSITYSIGFKDNFKVITIISVCIMCSRLLCGLIYDRVSSQACGFYLLFCAYVSFALAIIVGMFVLNKITVYIMTVLCGVTLGPAVFLPLTMLVAEFGRPVYSPVSAGLFPILGVAQLLQQVFVGYIYDAKVTQLGRTGHFCYGTDCFFWSFTVLLLIAVLTMLIQLINFMTYRKISKSDLQT